jgi:hypothetical protein
MTATGSTKRIKARENRLEVYFAKVPIKRGRITTPSQVIVIRRQLRVTLKNEKN